MLGYYCLVSGMTFNPCQQKPVAICILPSGMNDNDHNVKAESVCNQHVFNPNLAYEGFIMSLPDFPEYIRVDPNGDFFFKGKKVVNDIEIYLAIRDYFSVAKQYRDANSCN